MDQKRFHYGWVVIFMGFVTTVAAHGFGRMAYTIILPAMRDGLGLNYTQLGLLGTGNFVGYLIMAIIGGFLAAKFGTRIVISLALVLMGATMILTGIAQSFSMAFFMRFLTGLGNGASYVPAMALGSTWFAMKKRGLPPVSYLRESEPAPSSRACWFLRFLLLTVQMGGDFPGIYWAVRSL